MRSNSFIAPYSPLKSYSTNNMLSIDMKKMKWNTKVYEISEIGNIKNTEIIVKYFFFNFHCLFFFNFFFDEYYNFEDTKTIHP